MHRTEVRPLAQVGLAEDHRAGLAQAPHQERVPAGPEILQRQRARGGGHGYGVDVVLQQYRDAVQRAAQLAGLALGIERIGVLQGGLHEAHGVLGVLGVLAFTVHVDGQGAVAQLGEVAADPVGDRERRITRPVMKSPKK